MNTITTKRVATAAAAALAAVLLFSQTPLGEQIIDTALCDSSAKVNEQVLAAGFQEGDFVVNPDLGIIPETAEAHLRGDGAFTQDGVYTKEQVENYINADATLKSIIDERLDGRTNVAWVPVYFTVAVDIGNNLGFDSNGQLYNFGTRHSGVGELIWFPVDQSSCQVVQNLIIRAGCSNPGSWVAPPCTEGCNPPPNPCPHGTDQYGNCIKDVVDSVDPVPGFTPAPLDDPEAERPGLPTNPAPIIEPTATPTSTSVAPGATPAPSPTPMPTITNTPGGSGGTCVPIEGLITCPAGS